MSNTAAVNTEKAAINAAALLAYLEQYATPEAFDKSAALEAYKVLTGSNAGTNRGLEQRLYPLCKGYMLGNGVTPAAVDSIFGTRNAGSGKKAAEAVAAAKAEAEAAKAEAAKAKEEAEAATLATITEAAFKVLEATNGNTAALAGMPEAAAAAALEQWNAAEAEKRNAANAEAAALLAECAAAAGVEAAALLNWIEAVKATEAKKSKESIK